MRRYVLVILFFLVLLLPFVMRAALTDEGDSAKASSSARRLVIVTANNQDIRREFERAFAAWHREKYNQDVVLDYRMPGGANDIRRQLETTYRAARDTDGKLPANFLPDIDLVWGGGDYFFDVELKTQARVLQPASIDPQLLKEAFPSPALAGVKLYDYRVDANGNPQPPTWVGTCLSSFGIVYNPDLYKTLNLPPPKQWADLADERLDGLVALADPTHSASVASAYMIVLQRAMADAEEQLFQSRPDLKKLPKPDLAKNADYLSAIARGWKVGMGKLLLIAANARYFTASGSQVPNDVGNGGAAAGIAIDFYGRVYQEQVGPDRCRFVSPVAATAINPDPIAILDGVKGDRYELANRFISFLLTKDAQKIWALKANTPGGPTDRALRRMPVRADVYAADRANWSDPDINPFEDAGGFNQRSEWMVLFSDTRPVWRAAWIDSRDALKDAHDRILRVPDPARRAALLDQLADLPIALQDVANDAATRRKLATEHGDLSGWRARHQIELGNRFRAHYARVARQAENPSVATNTESP